MHFSRRIHDQISSKWEKHKKRAQQSHDNHAPNVLIICLYGFTAKIQNFFQELQFAIDVFSFSGIAGAGVR